MGFYFFHKLYYAPIYIQVIKKTSFKDQWKKESYVKV